MYGLEYLAGPLAFYQCKRCGHSSFYESITDAFVCVASGEREEVRQPRHPAERLHLVERLRHIDRRSKSDFAGPATKYAGNSGLGD